MQIEWNDDIYFLLRLHSVKTNSEDHTKFPANGFFDNRIEETENSTPLKYI